MTPDITPGPYTLLYEDLTEGWCRARVKERPEASAEGTTREEAREFAIQALMGVLRAESEARPPRLAA